jgi:hypothetical protein
VIANEILRTTLRVPVDARVIIVRGDLERSAKAFSSLCPHGYYAIKSEVVGAIASSLREHGG